MSRLKKLTPRLQTASHSLKMTSGNDSARGKMGNSSTARGYGYQWQKQRLKFLQEHPLCAMCSTDYLPVSADVVDHITPHKGNRDLFWDKRNWQALCYHCHNSRKQKLEKQRQRQG